MIQPTTHPNALDAADVTLDARPTNHPSRQLAPAIAGLARFLESLELLLADQGEDDQVIRPFAKSALMKGLRVRPVLVYLGYNLLNETAVSNDAVVSLAAALELVHKASVILDDLVDGDDQRRGNPTFHTRHGNANSILFSFWLVNQANHVMHGLAESSQVSRHVAAVLLRYYDSLSGDLTTGALHELAAKDSPSSAVECMRMIARQSATLISTCLASGFAMSNDTSPALLEDVESLGHRIDQGRFSSSEHWSDIVSNRKNLVVSIAYGGMAPDERRRWHECLDSYHHDAGTVDALVRMIESTRAVRQIETWLTRHRGLIATQTARLPDTPARNLLIGALESGGDRSLFGGQTFHDLLDRLRLTYGLGTD
jgi:geranylgeranyl pyrophosphate synthase